MRPYPSPCNKYSRDQYTCTGCGDWRKRYYIRQRWINAYARKISKKKQEAPASPCGSCGAAEICDDPCKAYLRWWDEWMGWFRRVIYGQA